MNPGQFYLVQATDEAPADGSAYVPSTKELEILLTEKKKLLVYARMDGMVGSVLCKVGEKVMVYPMKNRERQVLVSVRERLSRWLNLSLCAAELGDSDQKSKGVLNIQRSNSLGNIPEIEASGLIYMPDLEQFLLVGDETEDKAPVLYLMDQDAMVREKVLICGMETINDMEAICEDDHENIFVACSQSRKKDGSLPDNRKILAKI